MLDFEIDTDGSVVVMYVAITYGFTSRMYGLLEVNGECSEGAPPWK